MDIDAVDEVSLTSLASGFIILAAVSPNRFAPRQEKLGSFKV
jgi:hypothetical protein